MAWDGNGNYVLSPTYYPEVNGTVIDAVRYNGLMTDLKTALNNVVAKDGQVALTGNLPAGGFKITNLAVGSVAGDSTRFEQVWRNGAATIASAGTTELGSSAAGVITVSGTTTITSFGSTAETGQMKALIFSGVLTLTHNATSLILPTGANIATAAGDTGIFVHLGSGNWKCVSYNRATGGTVIGGNTFAAGTVSAPGIAFTTDTDTGLYLGSANTVNVAAGGVNVASFGSTVTITPGVGANFTVTPATNSGGAGGDVLLNGAQGSTTGGKVILSPGTGGSTHGNIEFKRATFNESAIRITAKGHFVGLEGVGDARVPTISSGGGTSPTIVGSDLAFKISLGSSPGTTAIVIAFAQSYANAPMVIAQYQSDHIALRAVATTSGITITPASSMTAGHVIDVLVIGREAN